MFVIRHIQQNEKRGIPSLAGVGSGFEIVLFIRHIISDESGASGKNIVDSL